jgi:hypothetical protein
MKHFKFLLAAVLCTAAVFSANAQQKDKKGFVTAVRIEGNVTYKLGPDEKPYPLVAGKALPPGAIVMTGDNSVADLILGKAIDLPQAKWSPDRISLAHDSHVRGFTTYRPSADQNSIRLTPNSTLSIDKLTVQDTGSDTVSDTELELKKGKIFASVRKLSGASQYLIKLPTGVAGVRGTLFSISADGSAQCFESTGGGIILAITNQSTGESQTFVILPGFALNAGSTVPVSLSKSENKTLQQVFDALRTTYFHEVNLEHDHTDDHESRSGNDHDRGKKGGDEGHDQ